MKMKRIFLYAVILAALTAICAFPLNVRYGIDGVCYSKKIPLYAKLGGYLYRDWMYRDIANDITRDIKDDTPKVLAIQEWTNKNIKNGIPEGLKAMDDHPLNIIIRQYGCGDQLNDIFTILCSYAGYRAGMVKCFNAEKTRLIILSLVRVKNEWLIFDTVKGRYFPNKKGGIGSIDDYRKGDIVLTAEDTSQYKEYLDDLKNKDCDSLTRAEEQMPLKRFPARIRKALRGK